jgi:hypothetical protein
VREARQGGLTPHRGRYGTTVGRGGLTGRTRTPGGTTYNGGRLPPPRLEAGRTTTTGGLAGGARSRHGTTTGG